jgi:predicted metal-dependent hydrolase
MIIEIDDKTISVEIKYSRRRTLYMRVVAQDSIEIRSPFGINDKKLLDFIVKNGDWIKNQLNRTNIRPRIKLYNDGEIFYLLGEGYKLKISRGYRNHVSLNETEDTISLELRNGTNIKDILIGWYKETAKCHIKERVNYYESIIGVKSGKITIKNQKTIWGSCSAKGNLNFNLKLIMMPQYVIDYVIVHEICHLIHFNHSKEFWKMVEEIIPDYKERRKYLKINGGEYYL